MSRSQGEINRNVILTALLDHPSEVMETLTDLIIGLGAMSEWDMEQNFYTTETIAALAGKVGLHHAGDQSREGHEFYALAAREIGHDDDFEDDEEDE